MDIVKYNQINHQWHYLSCHIYQSPKNGQHSAIMNLYSDFVKKKSHVRKMVFPHISLKKESYFYMYLL